MVLERALQQAQQQLYSQILLAFEQHSQSDLHRWEKCDGFTSPKLHPPSGREGGHTDASLRFAGAAGADLVSEHTVSGRRSLTYDLARKASAPSDDQPSRATSKKSVSLTDVLEPEASKPRGCIGRLVSSWQFEAFFAAVILTNSVFIGAVLQWESENAFTSMPTSIYAVSLGYGILFTVELVLRMIAAGLWDFYCKANWAWNFFDTLVVASVIYEFLTEWGAGQSTSMSSNLRILRVVRLTRLTRIVRVLRIARFLRPLRTLVQSILGTLKALVWAMLLLTLINYVFAAIFTDVVGNFEYEVPQLEAEDDLQLFFGTLQASSLTLFMAITGGLSWFEATQPLKRISWLWVYVFCVYIAFCLFALLNALTLVVT